MPAGSQILVLDSGNYGMVVDSKAAVVFAVADGKTFEGGPELAKELEGLARVAVFDTENKAEFVASVRSESPIPVRRSPPFSGAVS